jgi:Protein of unknown function (DUF3303)
MLFMVIEIFKDGDARRVGERFAKHGRMLPPGVEYRQSWMDVSGTRCFQLMESPEEKLLKIWTSKWDDLVEFELVPVATSAEFWTTMGNSPGPNR